MMKNIKLHKYHVYWKTGLIFIISLYFIQCSNNPKQELPDLNAVEGTNTKQESTIPKSKTLNNNQDTTSISLSSGLKPPKIVFTDNCPNPRTFTILNTGTTSVVIQTKKGPKTIKLEPPKTVPASFISYMQNYNTEQGLALSSISFGHKSSICDRLGNLWFGTQGGGVSRYDGKSFTNFTTAQGLANNYVRSITEDKTGNLWFGTSGGGVSRYDGKSFINFTTAQGLANNTVLSITEDKARNLWFGTYGGGVSRYDGKSFTNFTTIQGLANNLVLSITEDKKGNLWFGTQGGGVSRYDGKSFTNFTTVQGLASNIVLSIMEDKAGNLWFGTEEGGVSRYDGKSFTNFTTTQGLANNTIVCITEDKTENLWFGTYGGGVSRYNGKSLSTGSGQQFTNFTTAQGLANNTVWSITEDKTGKLWFGTEGGGVSRYDGQSFTNFTTAQGLAYNYVLSITEDKIGNLWFGTARGGVSRYDGKSFTNFTTTQGLANNSVFSIREDKVGNLWFGTFGGGVSRYDGKSFTNFTTAQGLANNTVWCITEDKAGTLWFGTARGGASRYDGKSFTNFTTAQGLADNIVFSITEDKGGNIWFGTAGGVSRYNGRYFSNFTTAQGLADNTVFSITEDKMGNLWFGTEGGGISRYDGKSFANFTTTQGLANNSVMAIIQDQKGMIWVGTNLGLSGLSFEEPRLQKKNKKINTPAGLINVSNDKLKTFKPVWEIYNNNTGYPVKDVNGSSNNGAMLCDSKGIIWVGTGDDKTALVRFEHNAVFKSKRPLPVILQSIKINNENICWYNLNKRKKNYRMTKNDSLTLINEEFLTFGKELTNAERLLMQHKFKDIHFDSITKFYPIPKNLVLPFIHNNVTFEFNAVEPGRHFLVRYQYILEGYDKEWSPVTDKTTASFGNIFEGSYVFKLKACSPDGIWSVPITYAFKVLPPWWRTWWMYCIYVIVFFCILYIIYSWRVVKLHKEKQMLEEKVKLHTAQLQQAHEEITVQKDIVTQQKEHIDQIYEKQTNSIRYAERIQQAALPDELNIKEKIGGEFFILFKPKDIVSGDFYFVERRKQWLLIAVADCTGHGVHGAFLSMLGISFLNEIIAKEDVQSASHVLEELRKYIIQSLQQKEFMGDQQDGMDIAFIALNTETNELQFAGANIPLYVIAMRCTEHAEMVQPEVISTATQSDCFSDLSEQAVPHNEDYRLTEIIADKMPIGLHEDMQPFKNNIIKVNKGDKLYIFSDGFINQPGGENHKQYLSERFKESLLKIAHLPMQEQKENLNNIYENWKGNNDQIDDVTILGIKIQ